MLSSRMDACRKAHCLTASGDHSPTAASSLRNRPSPEQGASTSITSKTGPRRPTSTASFRVIITWGLPHLVRFSCKMRARLPTTSLATSKLFSGNRDKARVDLPPGAAHKSSIRYGSADGVNPRNACFSACSTNIDEASCT